MTSSRVPIAEGQRQGTDHLGRRLLIHTPELGSRCRCRGCGFKRATRRADGRRWMADQDDALRELYGTMAPSDVAAELNRRFGTGRSEAAVYSRAQELGLSAKARSWGVIRLAETLGVAPRTMDGWIEDGSIAAFSIQRATGTLRMRRVSHAEARRFVFEHWRRIEVDAIADADLRAVHQVASRRVRWLSTGDVARRLKTTADRIRLPLEEGRVPGAWRARGIRGGGRAWGWRIPETALSLISRLLAEDAERYRIERQVRFSAIQPLGNLARFGATS